MMGRRQLLKGGDEVDAASKRARRVLKKRPGVWARIKAKMNRRWRKESRPVVAEE